MKSQFVLGELLVTSEVPSVKLLVQKGYSQSQSPRFLEQCWRLQFNRNHQNTSLQFLKIDVVVFVSCSYLSMGIRTETM